MSYWGKKNKNGYQRQAYAKKKLVQLQWTISELEHAVPLRTLRISLADMMIVVVSWMIQINARTEHWFWPSLPRTGTEIFWWWSHNCFWYCLPALFVRWKVVEKLPLPDTKKSSLYACSRYSSSHPEWQSCVKTSRDQALAFMYSPLFLSSFFCTFKVKNEKNLQGHSKAAKQRE